MSTNHSNTANGKVITLHLFNYIFKAVTGRECVIQSFSKTEITANKGCTVHIGWTAVLP